MKIALIDSGIGGLTLFRELIKECPKHQYVYFADTYAHPYGSKKERYLLERLRSIVTYLYEINVEVVVLACNTASTIALESLKKEFALNFIGVIPSLEGKVENTLIMCTPLTAKSNRIISYKQKGAQVYVNPCLAMLVERYYNDLKKLKEYLYYELKSYQAERVILGCTHYVFLKDIVEEIVGAKCSTCFEKVIDVVKAFPKGEEGLRFIFTGGREEGRYKDLLFGDIR